ncbi:MAG: signal peptidase I [Euryarchaeota archaeon]|nr:signal peptidase I [Euryarchaeota archaeon]MBV1729835.1 signal peptidase I [Methanobacterium sp.]MBU4547709.1 signal peptidase I [Euryarchaeota archaeon]MBU4607351.1 signal peptidase I [Euryarchaeota archaeon]MBV1754019.1 signal peptidase I [Methanobacterium sp.]
MNKISNKVIILILIMFLIASASLIGAAGILLSSDIRVVVDTTMSPAINRGDIVIINKNPGSIVEGDVVIYDVTWNSNQIIARVDSIKNDSNGNPLYEMKGDNNPDPYPGWVPLNEISKVVYVYPEIGHITLMIMGL